MAIDTRLIIAKDEIADIEGIKIASDILRRGGLVAIPTETVYGMAANALDRLASGRIFQVKGRPPDNPLIVHISKFEDLARFTAEIPDKARLLADSFWPGPLTMVLKSNGVVPDVVSAGLETVAVRMPSHPIARKIIETAGIPLAAPSANISGIPSPTSANHCVDDLWGKVEAIVDGGRCEVGVESTVVTLADPIPRLLRPGAVTHAQLESVLGRVEIDRAVLNPVDNDAQVSSPGMKHKHYSPKAPVTLLDGSADNVMRFLSSQKDDGVWALVFEEDLEFLPLPGLSLGSATDSGAQAFRLFAALRELDEKGAKKIYARLPSQDGIGLAVYNRLIRAAGFKKIEI